MNEKNNFTVTILPLLFYCCLFLIGAGILIIITGIVTSEPLYFIAVPAIFFALMGITYQKRFKITVNDRTITVRPWIGRTYSFDVSQIVNIRWRVVQNSYGVNGVIRIKTAIRRRRVEIGTMMIGAEEMQAYLLENVDSSKIKHTYRALGTAEENR